MNFSQYYKALETELEDIMGQRHGLLYNMMLYQMGWVDQQGSPIHKTRPPDPYPLLSLLSCESISGTYQAALPAAAAIELIDTYTEVHKDVQNGRPEQYNRASVWWVWGPGQAINVGDGLHALGRSALFRLSNSEISAKRILQALEILDEACIQMCEGQYLSLSHQERFDLSIDSYIRMAENYTGALTSASMALGALVATEDQTTIDTFASCGLKLGIAYQIKQDINSIWGPGADTTVDPEILNKKKGYPIALVLNNSDMKTKRELGNMYYKRVLEPSDVKIISTILENAGTRQLAEADALRFYKQATSILEDLDLPTGRIKNLLNAAKHILDNDENQRQHTG